MIQSTKEKRLPFTGNVRELILEILIRVEEQKSYLNILVPSYLNQYLMKKEDKALVQEIAYGVTRFKKKLDWMIDQFLIHKKKLPLVIRNILRMGTYQAVYLDKIPDYAICHEAVELAKKSRHSHHSKLVNAILRNIMRNRDSIDWPDPRLDPVQYISVYYSFPQWLIKRWLERFGLDICIQICQAANKKPDITLRVNPLKTSMPELKIKLSKEGVSFKEGEYLPSEAVTVQGYFDISHSALFREGLFSVQDKSSMLASRLLNPSPGETVIDMCSGPGGKTTHMAQLMGNQGEIIAFEKNQQRIKMIRDECQRLGITIVSVIQNDSSHLCADYLEKADKILVDVPCSGTGVIRKKPDLKWKNFNDHQLKNMNQLQGKILLVASRYLKSEGEILYSTCSIEKEENDEIVKNFLNQKGVDFTIQETACFVKKYHIKKKETEIKKAIQLIPGYSGENMDGFYMTKIKKINGLIV